MAAAISLLLRDIVCQSLSISRSVVLTPLVVRRKASNGRPLCVTHIAFWRANGRRRLSHKGVYDAEFLLEFASAHGCAATDW